MGWDEVAYYIPVGERNSMTSREMGRNNGMTGWDGIVGRDGIGLGHGMGYRVGCSRGGKEGRGSVRSDHRKCGVGYTASNHGIGWSEVMWSTMIGSDRIGFDVQNDRY